MKRREFLKNTGLASSCAMALGSSSGFSFSSIIQPNVPFIFIDDLNDWIGCLGGHPNALTPNIYELAKQGTLFTNLHEYFRQNGYKTMVVGKIFHNHVPANTVDESGSREKGFGPKPLQRWNWNRKGTSTDLGAFPERDEQVLDYRSAQ